MNYLDKYLGGGKSQKINFKKIILAFIIFSFVCMLSFGFVSAATHTVSANTFSNVQATIDGSSSGDTVNFAGRYCNGSGSEISVTTPNLVLNGQGATLDARSNSRVLNIDADNIVVQNMVIRNGNSNGYGAGIFVASSNFRLSNCTIVNNVGDSGAGVMVRASSTGTIIDNCAFSGNIARNGADKNGGALDIHGSNVRVSNTNFTNNRADNCAGALMITSGSSGIFINNINITNCRFTSNVAVNNGGGMHISSSASNIRVVSCVFTSNVAPNGGGIDVASPIIINSSTFRNNNATKSNGGAIYSTGALTIIKGTFDSNNAKNNGGGVYITGSGTSTITSSSFIKNKAKNGGAIYTTGNLNITKGKIQNNTVSNCGSGVFSTATLRISKGTNINSNLAKVISISIKAKPKSGSSKKIIINYYLKTGDNIIEGVYNKNGRTYFNGSSTPRTILSSTPGKKLVSNFAGKKSSVKLGTNGIGKKEYPAKSGKIIVSYSQSGKTWSKQITIKVSKSTKKTKIKITKKTKTKIKSTKKNPSSITKSGSKSEFNIKNHENAHLISLNYNLSNYKIDSIELTYWNLKKNTTLNAFVDYIYLVNKTGWYFGSKNNKGDVIWNKTNTKPNTSFKWFNLNYNSVKKEYSVGNEVPKYTNDVSTTPRYYFISVKTTINHGSLTPYIRYSCNLVNKNNAKDKKRVRFFEEANTDIYFIGDLSNSERDKYKEALIGYKKNTYLNVNDSVVRNQVINILKDYKFSAVNGQLTSLSKSKAIFKWVSEKEKYKLYNNSRRKDTWSIPNIKAIKGKGGHIRLINCADHSHVTVSLLRTAGIPAVYAHGKCTFGSESAGHYWACAYISSAKKWHWLDTIHSGNKKYNYTYNSPGWTKYSFKAPPKLTIDKVILAKNITNSDLKNHK